MHPQQETALESCQRVEAMLRSARDLTIDPGTESLNQCEAELGQAAVLLEALVRHGATKTSDDHTSLRQSLQEIQRAADAMQRRLEHGSNYCMGLLQTRLGTGYSQQGLPVLIPGEARSSFEG